jgi:hypothetical protein
MMAVIGLDGENRAVEIATCCSDDISWIVPASRPLRTDCILKSGSLHFWGRGTFRVGDALSSIDIEFIPSQQ